MVFLRRLDHSCIKGMFSTVSTAVPNLHQVKNVCFNYSFWFANKGSVSESGERR